MKQKKVGRIVAWCIVAAVILLVGGYFAATRLLGVEVPFMEPVENTIAGVFGGVGGSGETVYVQSVANILGVGYSGHSNRYSGVVEAKDVIEINPDSNLTIAERYVEAGDPVYAGTALFSYDVESLQLSYEQMQIDLTGLDNSIRSATEEIASLEKRIAKTKENKQYELKLKLQEVQLTLKKSEYERKSKLAQAAELEKAIADSVVKSPVAGRVRSVRADGDSAAAMFGQEQSNAYITIVAGTDYCVKGTVNEQTVRTLTEGMTVTVRPRTDDSLYYLGTIYRINTDEPISENNNYYYYDGGSGERSSKYAFYVSFDSIEGLMMGQHVFIELGEPSDDDGKLWLPSYYLVDNGLGKAVYAAGGKGRIELRPVTVGAYSEERDSYEITAGLGFTDRIAFPDESVREGLPYSETSYAGENGGMIGGEIDMPMDGMDDPFGENGDMEFGFDPESGDDMFMEPDDEPGEDAYPEPIDEPDAETEGGAA